MVSDGLACLPEAFTAAGEMSELFVICARVDCSVLLSVFVYRPTLCTTDIINNK